MAVYYCMLLKNLCYRQKIHPEGFSWSQHLLNRKDNKKCHTGPFWAASDAAKLHRSCVLVKKHAGPRCQDGNQMILMSEEKQSENTEPAAEVKNTGVAVN